MSKPKAQPETLQFDMRNTLHDFTISAFARLQQANLAREAVECVNQKRQEIRAELVDGAGDVVGVVHEAAAAMLYDGSRLAVDYGHGWDTRLALLHDEARPGQIRVLITGGTRPEHLRQMLEAVAAEYESAYEQLNAEATRVAEQAMLPKFDDDIPF